MKTLITAAIAASVAAVALAATAGGQTSPTTLTFHQVHVRFKFVDVPPKAGKHMVPSLGDTFVVAGTLERGGKSIGTSNIVCTVTRAGAKGQSTCIGALSTPDGTLTANGLSRFATNGDAFAITGGTGQYAGAKGTLTAKQRKDGSDTITVQLG